MSGTAAVVYVYAVGLVAYHGDFGPQPPVDHLGHAERSAVGTVQNYFLSVKAKINRAH